jgi:plastocyanin
MKKVFIAVFVVLVLSAGGWALFMQSDPNNDTPSNTPTSSGQDNATSDSSSSETSSATVNITNTLFSPSQVTIQKGDNVTWTNNDTADHTVTADTGNGPKSETIKPGSKYTYTFDEAGSFQYHCDFHSAMHGTVVVQ